MHNVIIEENKAQYLTLTSFLNNKEMIPASSGKKINTCGNVIEIFCGSISSDYKNN